MFLRIGCDHSLGHIGKTGSGIGVHIIEGGRQESRDHIAVLRNEMPVAERKTATGLRQVLQQHLSQPDGIITYHH